MLSIFPLPRTLTLLFYTFAYRREGGGGGYVRRDPGGLPLSFAGNVKAESKGEEHRMRTKENTGNGAEVNKGDLSYCMLLMKRLSQGKVQRKGNRMHRNN